MAELKEQGIETGGRPPATKLQKYREIPGTIETDPSSSYFGQPQRDFIAGEFSEGVDLSGLSPNQIRAYVAGSVARQRESGGLPGWNQYSEDRHKEFLDFPKMGTQYPDGMTKAPTPEASALYNRPSGFRGLQLQDRIAELQRVARAARSSGDLFTAASLEDYMRELSGDSAAGGQVAVDTLRARMANTPGFLEFLNKSDLSPEAFNTMPENSAFNLFRRFAEEQGVEAETREGGFVLTPPPMTIETLLNALAPTSQVDGQAQVEPSGVSNIDDSNMTSALKVDSSLSRLGYGESDRRIRDPQAQQAAVGRMLDRETQTFNPFAPKPTKEETDPADPADPAKPVAEQAILTDSNINYLITPQVISFLNSRASEGTLSDSQRTLLGNMKTYLQVNYPPITTQTYVAGALKEESIEQDAGLGATIDAILDSDNTVKGLKTISAQLNMTPREVGLLDPDLVGTLIEEAGKESRDVQREKLEFDILKEALGQKETAATGTATANLLQGMYGDAFAGYNLAGLPAEVQQALVGKAPMFQDPPKVDKPTETIGGFSASLLSLLSGIPLEQITGTARGELGSISQLLQLLPKDDTETKRATPNIRMVGGG